MNASHNHCSKIEIRCLIKETFHIPRLLGNSVLDFLFSMKENFGGWALISRIGGYIVPIIVIIHFCLLVILARLFGIM